ncbi:MAG TPA: S53 family peptidase [Candidatus Bathyarchaeia archaeon]|nr:S53 family peptidase [Candidatus Bathyarchaeia archaeon]
MKKILGIMAIAVSISMLMSPVAFASLITNAPSSGNFQYSPLNYRIQVSPDTIIPDALPFCRASSGLTLICYTPTYLRSAYNFPSNLDGTGQTILIVDAFGSPTITNDLTVFDQRFNLPAADFTILCPSGGCPVYDPTDTHHDETGWAFETSLDVEYAHAMAPGAKIVLVVASTSSGNAINVAEANAISLYPGSIMSQSFGIPEFLVHNNNAQVKQANNNYLAAQAAGITVFASAGDAGATNGGPFANALFPASNPLNIAVAGTEGNPYIAPGTVSSCAAGATCSAGLASVTGPCNSGRAFGMPQCTPAGYGGEQVWNEAVFNPGATTGGAPSLLFGVPSFQAGLTYNGAALTSRNTADVAYNAAINGGVLVFTSFLGFNAFFFVGGTSAGSPQWAAIGALANQAAGRALGTLNPAIYKIGNNPTMYARDFHDITVGNNVMTGTSAGFNAATGWDPATGWGTPNVANLIPDLVANA